MEENPLLSIIVPVYNSEEYLVKAFNSVLRQNYKNFELILVNDGSTDRSAEVCREYAQKDKRVQFFSKKNGGLCSARNYGIEHAKGDYLMFMDNDDEYVDGAFSVIADAIHTFGTDIIRFNRKRIQIYDDNSQKFDIYGTRGIVGNRPVKYDRNDFFNDYKNVRKSGCFSGIWNGVFKRDLFEKIRFDESITAGGEDAIINIELYRIFSTITFLPDILYVYYRRARHSISTQFQTNQIMAVSKEASLERELLRENGISDDEYFSYAYVYLAVVIKMLNHKNSTLEREEKYDFLDRLKKISNGFQYTLSDIKATHISFIKKKYLKMYIKRQYRSLMIITNMIMRIRGNI